MVVEPAVLQGRVVRSWSFLWSLRMLLVNHRYAKIALLLHFFQFSWGKSDRDIINLFNRADGMKMRITLFAILSVCMMFVLGGCSRSSDYTPSAGNTGEEIFRDACAKCHSPVSDKVMVLKAEMANTKAITERVKNGKGFGMPAFPNLEGDSLQALADYVLENSATAQ